MTRFDDMPPLGFERSVDGQIVRIFEHIEGRRIDLGVVCELTQMFKPFPADRAFTIDELWQVLRYMESRRSAELHGPFRPGKSSFL